MTNTHIATAKFRQEGVHEWQSREGDTDATNLAAALDALTEATLAVAYEQQTANMIAYQANVERSYMQPIKYPRSANAGALNADINERLGLEGLIE